MGISFSAFVFLVLLTSESSVFRHCLGLFLVVVVVVVEFGGSLGFLGFLGSVRPATAERRGGGEGFLGFEVRVPWFSGSVQGLNLHCRMTPTASLTPCSLAPNKTNKSN